MPTSVRKNEEIKTTAKRGRKPAIKKEVAVDDAPKQKRAYNRKPKKVNLTVRNISAKNESSDREEMTTRSQVQKSDKRQARKTVKEAIGERPELLAVEDGSAASPRARIVRERSEDSKRIIMWAGVSFFMILIAIFWLYNTKQSIDRSREAYKPTEQATSWKEMSDELNKQIASIKEGVSAIHEFASSSEANTEGRDDIFQKGTGTSTGPVDESIIDNLKRDLETKAAAKDASDQAFYFVMDEKAQESFLRALAGIQEGANIGEVRSALGEADYSQEIKDQRGMFIANVLSYYVKIYKKDLPNERYDRYVSFEFDQSGKLLRINRHLD